MKVYKALLHGLMVWYLILPAIAENSNTKNSEPTNVLLGSYNSRAQCEQELRSLRSDPALAAKVKSAKCLPAGEVDAPAQGGR